MDKVFWVCLICGIVVPAINLLFDIFDGVADFFDFDFDSDFGGDFNSHFDVHIGNFPINFLPLSLMSLAMASLFFGGLGLILHPRLPLGAVCVIAGIVAYVAAVITQSLILYLKRISRTAASQDEKLSSYDVFVDTRIPENGFGSIRVLVEGDSVLTFPAKSLDGEALAVNERVFVVEKDAQGTYLVKRMFDVAELK